MSEKKKTNYKQMNKSFVYDSDSDLDNEKEQTCTTNSLQNRTFCHCNGICSKVGMEHKINDLTRNGLPTMMTMERTTHLASHHMLTFRQTQFSSAFIQISMTPNMIKKS